MSLTILDAPDCPECGVPNLVEREGNAHHSGYRCYACDTRFEVPT